MKIKDFLYIYAIGAIGYSFIEILWRGHTHWSMGLLGGICMITIYFLNIHFKNMNILIKAALAAVVITVFELVTGVIVNIIFDLAVWDYSQMRFNILGQISLLYSFLWYILCIPCLILCKILKHRIFDVLSKQQKALNKNF